MVWPAEVLVAPKNATVQQNEEKWDWKQTFGWQIEELIHFMGFQFNLRNYVLLLHLQTDKIMKETSPLGVSTSPWSPTLTPLLWVLVPTGVCGAAAGKAAGPSGGGGPSPGARERERVGSREGASHRRLSMASSCSMAQSAGSPSDSAAEKHRRHS